MKKIVCILVLLCVILGCFCSCANEIKNRESYNKGLRLLEAGRYSEAYVVFKNLGDYEDSAEILSHFVYVRERATVTDSQGVSTEEMYYNEDNLPIQKIVTDHNGHKDIYEYTYYSNGLLKSEVLVDTLLHEHRYFYKYDAHNNLIKKTYIDYDGSECVETYVYDDDDRLVKHVIDDRYYTYEYDDNGNVVREIKYLNGKENRTRLYTYDVNGQMIRQIIIQDAWPTVTTSRYDYTYDYGGNLTKEVETKGNKITSTTHYVYDEGSRVIQIYDTDDKGKVTYSRKYEYDEQGRLISEPQREYTYDARGNLVKVEVPDPYQPIGRISEYECKLVYIPYDLSEMSEPTLTNLINFLGNPFMEID